MCFCLTGANRTPTDRLTSDVNVKRVYTASFYCKVQIDSILVIYLLCYEYQLPISNTVTNPNT